MQYIKPFNIYINEKYTLSDVEHIKNFIDNIEIATARNSIDMIEVMLKGLKIKINDFLKNEYSDLFNFLELKPNKENFYHIIAEKSLLSISETTLKRGIPESVKLLKNINTIGVQDVNIQNIKILDNLRFIQTTKEVILQNCRLKDIPDFLFALQNLNILNLNDNSITDISDIGKLKNLTRLDLKHNPLKKLDNSITDLKHLRVLHLAGCEYLSDLPPNFSKLNTLMLLNIKHTNINVNVARSLVNDKCVVTK